MFSCGKSSARAIMPELLCTQARLACHAKELHKQRHIGCGGKRQWQLTDCACFVVRRCGIVFCEICMGWLRSYRLVEEG